MGRIKHGFCTGGIHPLFSKWRGMKRRCEDVNCAAYNNYGGRGILLCKEWSDNPEMFIKWGLVNGWRSGLEIDRIDNEVGYSPGNCRFVSRRDNMVNQRAIRKNNTSGFRGVYFNKSNNKHRVQITIKGKRLSLGYFNDQVSAAKAYNTVAKRNGYPINEI